ADRSGLKVGEILVGANGFDIDTPEAGQFVASDTVEALVLLLGTDKTRKLTLVAPAVCRGTRSVHVVNRSGYNVTVVMYRGTARRTLGVIAPGEGDLPIPLTDSAFRAYTPTFAALLPTLVQQSLPRNQRSAYASTKVICNE